MGEFAQEVASSQPTTPQCSIIHLARLSYYMRPLCLPASCPRSFLVPASPSPFHTPHMSTYRAPNAPHPLPQRFAGDGLQHARRARRRAHMRYSCIESPHVWWVVDTLDMCHGLDAGGRSRCHAREHLCLPSRNGGCGDSWYQVGAHKASRRGRGQWGGRQRGGY